MRFLSALPCADFDWSLFPLVGLICIPGISGFEKKLLYYKCQKVEKHKIIINK
jgi:hypothetical protein